MTQTLTPRTTRSFPHWGWAVLLLVLLGLRVPALARPSGGDQGLYAHVAQRVLHGDVPYRDAWEQKPPAIFFVYAAASLVWPSASGVSVVAAADFLAAALLTWLLVRLGRQMFGGRVGEGSAALFLLLSDPGIQKLGGVYVRAQCETFIAAAVTAALVLVWRPALRPWHGLLAGVCLALTFWLKYNAIVYAIPIGLAAVLFADGSIDRRRTTRTLVWMAAGAAGVFVLVLGYFAAAGALTDLWLATISYNVRYSGETYAGFVDAVRYVLTLPFDRARVDGLWFMGFLGVVLLVAFRRFDRATTVALAWIGAAILSIAINGSRGLPQYFVQAAPALALAAAAGMAAAWRLRHEAPVRAVAAGVLLVAGAWRVGVEGASPRLFGLPQAAANLVDDVHYVRGDLPRAAYLARFDRGDGGKFSPAPVERLAQRIADTTAPDEPAYVFGFASGAVLARANRPSASRFFWSRPVILEFAADHPGYGSAGLLADLQRNRPSVVALQKRDWGLAETTTPHSIDFFLNHAALRAWLEAGYVFDYEDAAFSVWRRTG